MASGGAAAARIAGGKTLDVRVATPPPSPLLPLAAPPPAPRFRLYRRRWLMLAIFVFFSMSNAVQWIQYAIVSNVVSQYYNVSTYAVDWTSIVYMVTYTPLVLPAAAFIDFVGLRRGLLLGAVVNAIGSWMKCASASPDRFAVSLAGQTVVAVAQVFILGVPPQLAAEWFGAEEVATACAFGVFGNMLGIAVSFVVTPMLVRSSDSQEAVGRDLARLFYSDAAAATVALLLIAGLFQSRPAVPPSAGAAVRAPRRPGVLKPLRRLLSRLPFCLLMAAASINVAAFSALSTLLNQIVLRHYQVGGEELAGRLGLVAIVSSMLGSVASGIILDRTHKFKETTLVLFALGSLSMLGFTFALPSCSQLALYAAAASVGCFMGGYMPVAFEFAAELTYPESENTTAGVLLAGSQVLAGLFTVAYAWLVDAVGDVWANLALSATLVLGTAIAALVRPDLRRQAASAAAAAVEALRPALGANGDVPSDATSDTSAGSPSPPGSPASPAVSDSSDAAGLPEAQRLVP